MTKDHDHSIDVCSQKPVNDIDDLTQVAIVSKVAPVFLVHLHKYLPLANTPRAGASIIQSVRQLCHTLIDERNVTDARSTHRINACIIAVSKSIASVASYEIDAVSQVVSHRLTALGSHLMRLVDIAKAGHDITTQTLCTADFQQSNEPVPLKPRKPKEKPGKKPDRKSMRRRPAPPPTKRGTRPKPPKR